MMVGKSGDWFIPTSEEERLAKQWYDTSDPAIGIGAKHHTVPALSLRPFADSNDRLLVRDRPTGQLGPSVKVSDLAITNFYTVVS